jgi:hypothetical protein
MIMIKQTHFRRLDSFFWKGGAVERGPYERGYGCDPHRKRVKTPLQWGGGGSGGSGGGGG